MRLSTRKGLPALFLLMLAGACSGGSARSGTAADPNVITAEQLGAAPYANAYDVVQSMRPSWLRLRGRTSISQQEYVRVYLDNSLLGGVDQLRGITTRSISSIRYLDGVRATERWGLDHGQGAIVVSTRRETKAR